MHKHLYLLLIISALQGLSKGDIDSCSCGIVEVGKVFKSKLGMIIPGIALDILKEVETIYCVLIDITTKQQSVNNEQQKLMKLRPLLFSKLNTCSYEMYSLRTGLVQDIQALKADILKIKAASYDCDLHDYNEGLNKIPQYPSVKNLLNVPFLSGPMTPLQRFSKLFCVVSPPNVVALKPHATAAVRDFTYAQLCTDLDILESILLEQVGPLLGKIECLPKKNVPLKGLCQSVESRIDNIVAKVKKQFTKVSSCLSQRCSEFKLLRTIYDVEEYCIAS